MCTVIRQFFFANRVLPDSFRQGRIILRPKGSAASSEPSSWRSIALLNVDYKLMASILSRRLREVLPKLLHALQVCSVPGRCISIFTCMTRDILEYTVNSQAHSLLVSLDHCKAFDCVEHGYLFDMLSGVGFSESSVGLFQALKHRMESQLSPAATQVASFSVGRGVRQGCALLPLLFAISLEPFLVSVRSDVAALELSLPGSTTAVVTAYAEDVTLYLRNPASLQSVLDIFDDYRKISGARLNLTKSRVLRLGG